MKPIRTLTEYPPGSLLNPAFRYRRAAETDVAATLERARRAQAAASRAGAAEPLLAVLAQPSPAVARHAQRLRSTTAARRAARDTPAGRPA